jgi:peptide/nickel transport system ATP-binding protein
LRGDTILGILLQGTYRANWGLALIEAIFSVLILYILVVLINTLLPKQNQIPKKIFGKSSSIISLILFGIIFAIRSVLEFLGYYGEIFRTLNNDELFFAIMITLFYPLLKIFLKGFGKSENLNVKDILELQFKKVFKYFTLSMWVIAGLFLSIDLLQIETYNPDIFYLSFIWILGAIIIDIIITLTINTTRSKDKKIPKDILRNSMVTGAIIASIVWSIQLFIFEIYLKRFFGIILMEQDIRLLFGVISLVYFVLVYLSLKYKFIPDATKASRVKIKEAFDLKKTEQAVSNEIDKNNVILNVKDLTTYFYTEEGVVRAVEGVSFKIYNGETLGLVGETGCGKSVTALSILQVVRPPGVIEKGEVRFSGEDLLQKSDLEMAKYRGKDITMIFQDPLNSINPVFKIGDQIAEVYLLHMENELLIETMDQPDKSIYSVAREWSENLLRNLNIPYPEVIFDRYPHELSGGMRQRVQIAMALACNPKLLIADEPTTALDVTIQNQILKLMKEMKQKTNTSILFITHDLGIISKMCDRVAVMYSGHIVEYGELERLFTKPYHPYTKGLIASVPVVGKRRESLEVIPGMVPNLIYPPPGCRFHPRCTYCFEPCDSVIPESQEVGSDYFVACHLYDPRYEIQAKISIKKVEKSKLS